MPFARTDCASSLRRSGWNTVRGCRGFRSIRSMRTCCKPCGSVAGDDSGTSFSTGLAGSSADSPLPNALRLSGPLVMLQDLFRELDVALCAFGTNVVEQY